MGIQCGIVGLPNVGKSTLFNALTKAGIAAANFPFCTIEPNVGVVPVPDPRLNQLAEIINPQKVIPTAVEFVDIAGLVAGAASGEGLGNKFLAHIREVDAITHVVRCFENDDVIHVNNRIDPISDIDTIVGAQAPYDPNNPTQNWKQVTASQWGWYKWFHARSNQYESNGDSGGGGRNWVLIGDDRLFFLFCTNAAGYG